MNRTIPPTPHAPEPPQVPLGARPSLPARLLLGVVQGYRFVLKPWLGSACRFEPTCSAYALQALQRHGAGVGSYLVAARILRCHPWCDGGCDAVPETAPPLFTRLFSKTPP